MCLLFLYVNPNPEDGGYRLILASNRDEFWQRPTDLVDYRDNKQWVGGADLEPGREGGTWLGISTTGKVAVLLNIMSPQSPDARGRGSLVRDYLTQEMSAEEYIEKLSTSANQYNPFHLFAFDLRDDCNVNCVTHYGNTQTHKMPPGIHSCDNAKHIHAPWRKREDGEAVFSHIVENYNSVEHRDQLVDRIIDMLNDKTQYYPDERLTEQFKEKGVSIDTDIILATSSRYVFTPQIQYGTRTNTVILVDKGGNCDYIERTLQTPVDIENPQWTTKRLEFKLSLS